MASPPSRRGETAMWYLLGVLLIIAGAAGAVAGLMFGSQAMIVLGLAMTYLVITLMLLGYRKSSANLKQYDN